MARRKGEGGGKESTYIFHIFNCTAARKEKAERGEALAKEANHVFTADTFFHSLLFCRATRKEEQRASPQHSSISLALF